MIERLGTRYQVRAVGERLGIVVTDDALREIEERQRETIAKHVPLGSVASVGVALILAIGLTGVIAAPLLWTLFFLKLVTALPRLPVLSRKYFAWIGRRSDRQWTMEVQFAADGLVWGGYALLLVWGEEWVAALIWGALIGTTSAAAAGLQVRLSSCLAFIVPVLGSLVVGLLLRGDRLAIIWVFGTVLFLYVQSASALRAQTRFVETLLENRERRERDFAVGAVNHEIRTPLQSIVGGMELLEARLQDRPDVAPVISRLKNAVTRIEQQLLDLRYLDLASRGEFDLVPEVFRLGDLSEVVQAQFGHRKRGVVAEARIHGDSAERVFGPRRRIEQVIENLAANAVRYTDAGRVDVDIAYYQASEMLEIIAADTGVGIPPEEVARVWTPFFRGRLTSGDRTGKGLGLAIVQSIVKAMGGEVLVESVVGKGTTFTVRVPVPTAATLKSRRVLVVDDDPDVREALHASLREIGAECDIAADGAGALDVLGRSGGYFFTLIDLQMSPMSGFILRDRIKGDRLESRAGRVLAMSANGTRVPASAGFDGFVPKPIRSETLRCLLAGYAVGRGISGISRPTT